LLGVGWWQYGDELNTYTRRLYRTVLDRDITHSVRDEFTADRLRSMGFNVLNTGCPTMWQLTEDHCAQIPSHQGARVVTTVTDYRRDPTRDRAMLMTLGDLYGQVLIWIQGSGDLPYLRSLDLPRETFNLISPTLTAYDDVLSMPGTDYVGTRLHAGIRALQHGRRSLILGVDNRAAETHRDFNVPFLAREDISSLGGVVSRPIATSVRIPEDAIRTWRRQFPQLRKTTDQS